MFYYECFGGFEKFINNPQARYYALRATLSDKAADKAPDKVTDIESNNGIDDLNLLFTRNAANGTAASTLTVQSSSRLGDEEYDYRRKNLAESDVAPVRDAFLAGVLIRAIGQLGRPKI